MKKIRVPFQLTQQDKFVSIPIQYFEEQVYGITTIYHCTVDLPPSEMPEWITSSFSIKKNYRKPITVTSIRPKESWEGVEAALFAGETMQHIRVHEMTKTAFLTKYK